MIFALAISASAQDWAKARLENSPRHQEWVAIKHGDRTVQTFVVYPEVKEKAPVVIIIHEIFGMSEWVEGVADQFAAAGYIAIAPDLLSGMAPDGGRTTGFKDVGEVREAISKLPPAQIIADLNACSDYGIGLPAANKKLFVAGFCWGGSQSFNFATERKDLSAAFVFYGTPPEKDALANINTPVYGFYGGNDARVSSTVDPTQKLMDERKKTDKPTIFDGAGHGFMRAGEMPKPTDENKAARDKAWDAMLAVMKPFKS
ncbi:dienelactone hydrolase family protein [soil metagenome]